MPAMILSLAGILLPVFSYAQTQPKQIWSNVGPYGGDARSFAYSPADPSHLLMGTTNSWIYESTGGGEWRRLSKISNSNSLVLDHILFDATNPQRVLVGAWRLERPDGGIYLSEDGGRKWQPVADMQGQSVRAMAEAPSNPKIFVAGTLKGVYRSEDGGLHWARISPADNPELHEFESIAIDPVNPDIIYAGTWHLPWKTTDGGKTWNYIKNGLIVDSDVFSIIIDPHAPNVVYTSACSGIYKSTDAGGLFHKIQGIPSTARRTRVLKQDPNHPDIVYGGTTEGLYRTVDAGAKWTLMTPKDIIVNDVYIDPKNSDHVLMATDRSGVLESRDGAKRFEAQNQGFSEREVSAMVSDPKTPGTLYTGVLNDKRFGGVFVSRDSAQSWSQISSGLDGNDIFSLAISPEGTLLAGTNHGVYRLAGDRFEDTGKRLKEKTRKVVHFRKKKRVVTTLTSYIPDGKIEGAVGGVAFADGHWYVATTSGVYASADNGAVWRGGPVEKTDAFTGIAASGSTVVATTSHGLFVSPDQGKTWGPSALPSGWSRARYVAAGPDGKFWLGGRLGVAYSDDQGKTWQNCGVPTNDISGLQYDAGLDRIIATSYSIDLVYSIEPSAKKWTWWNPGWRIHVVRSTSGRLVAATLLHGVIVQQENPSTTTAAGGN